MVVLSELCALSNNLIMRGKLSVPYDKLSTPTRYAQDLNLNLQHHIYCIALLSFACCLEGPELLDPVLFRDNSRSRFQCQIPSSAFSIKDPERWGSTRAEWT